MTEERFVDGPVGARITLTDDDPMRSDPVFASGYKAGKLFIADVIANDRKVITADGLSTNEDMIEAAAWGLLPEDLLEAIARGVHPDGHAEVRRIYELGIVVAARDYLGWASPPG